MPSRGNLVAAERACYNLRSKSCKVQLMRKITVFGRRISDRSDIAITVSPLTDCRPEVQVATLFNAVCS